ncbi:Ldh family oxidoreductase [Roseomonas elaeocarpi]|uniref:Ldh family oxidoreductase n=1 Tax=Roseomonas elaeocarpi TaxID=907779 RepID=A0ABV6JVB4_9PROT
MPRITLAQAHLLVRKSLVDHGASGIMAGATSRALVGAEAAGQAGHGLSRVPMYTGFLRTGRADGKAQPVRVAERGGAVLIDARNGLAYPALEIAEAEAGFRTKEHGISVAGVTNSNHAGAMGLPVARLAREGLVALAFTHAPASMPMPGGKRPLFGTNPIAAAFPRRDAPPLVIDLALSGVARGKILKAAQNNEPIPEGWALDAEGNPTTDPHMALEGTMLAVGGTKGALLAMMVELLSVALTGAALSFEADSFFREAGNQPRLGQVIMAIDPAAMAGQAAFLDRVEALVEAIGGDEGVRLPGDRRWDAEHRAEAEGVDIPRPLLDQLQELAGRVVA